jgi:hypothetical protein
MHRGERAGVVIAECARNTGRHPHGTARLNAAASLAHGLPPTQQCSELVLLRLSTGDAKACCPVSNLSAHPPCDATHSRTSHRPGCRCAGTMWCGAWWWKAVCGGRTRFTRQTPHLTA